MIRRLWILLFVGAGLPGAVLAQWSVRAGVESGYDSNPIGIAGYAGSGVHSLDGMVAYDNDLVTVVYEGTFTAYDAQNAFDHYLHEASVAVGTERSNAGIQLEQRIPTVDATYAYYRAGLWGRHRFDFESGSVSIQALTGLYRFAHIPERNQQHVGGQVRAIRWFQTGTTLMLDGGVRRVNYPDLYQLSGNEPTVTTTSASLTQGTWGLRLAQALDAQTGLALQLRGQTLAGRLDDLRDDGQTFAVVDDPSLYSSDVVGLELTRFFFRRRFATRLSAYRTTRRYATQGTYSTQEAYDVTTARKDRFTGAWLGLTWQPRPAFMGEHAIEVELTAGVEKNLSNSYWYGYGSRYASLGLTYTY